MSPQSVSASDASAELLFSATLTQNPEKLQQLDLHQPRLFSSAHCQAGGGAAPAAQRAERYDFPQGLTVTDELALADGSRSRAFAHRRRSASRSSTFPVR